MIIKHPQARDRALPALIDAFLANLAHENHSAHTRRAYAADLKRFASLLYGAGRGDHRRRAALVLRHAGPPRADDTGAQTGGAGQFPRVSVPQRAHRCHAGSAGRARPPRPPDAARHRSARGGDDPRDHPRDAATRSSAVPAHGRDGPARRRGPRAVRRGSRPDARRRAPKRRRQGEPPAHRVPRRSRATPTQPPHHASPVEVYVSRHMTRA